MPLPRPERLRKPEQFARVRRDGKTWAHPLFILNGHRNRSSRTRVGFVVAKQLGKAHDRNRAKRRASEAFRLVRTQVAPGWDLVVIIRKPVLTAPFGEVQRALIDLLRRAHIWTTLPEQEQQHVTPDRPGDHSPLSTLLSPDAS